MTGSIRRRLLAPAFALAFVGMLILPGGPVAAGQSGEPYVPFVTDFGHTPTAPASETPYVPFATDFGHTPTAVAPVPAEPSAPAAGLDWGDVAIGAAIGFGLAGLLAAGAVAVWARRGGAWLPGRNEAGRVAS
jgi:hypothetical protein